MAFYKKMTKRSLTSEMDKSVKRMLKLIEEEGDSFAKKAEMYYQKRPELISHVEEFYRMYRSLAERYDHLTGELRKNIPSDLQSQSSGISDNGSESAQPLVINKRSSRRKSGPRAAGFDFFLGSGGGSSDLSRKESDESSSSSSSADSDSESDAASSKNNSFGPPVNGDDGGQRRRIIELEVELREVKEKLQMAEKDNSEALSRVTGNGNYEELIGRITWYEEELKVANERVRLSEEKIARLKVELKQVLEQKEQIPRLETNDPDPVVKIEALEKELTITNKKLETSEKEIGRLKLEVARNRTSETIHDLQSQLDAPVNFENGEGGVESENSCISSLEADVLDREHRIEALEEDLNTRNNKLQVSEEEVARLKIELEKNEQVAGLETNVPYLINKVEALEGELTITKRKLEASEEEIGTLKLELQSNKSSVNNRIASLEADVMDRECKIESLEEELSIRNNKYQILVEEIAMLKVELEKNGTLVGTNASLQVQLESAQKDIETREAKLESEKSRILHLQEEIMKLETNVSDREREIGELKVTLSEAENSFSLEKAQLQGAVTGLSESCALLEAKLKDWESKVQALEEEIKRAEAEKNEIRLLQVTCETGMKTELEQLKGDLAERSSRVEELNKSLDALKLKYDMLMAERDELNAKVLALNAEVGSRDDQIHQNDEHLQRLHMQHVELISGSEAARKLVGELELKVKDLNEEVERQRIMISEGAEEKREAIRQLCFSLEHYRNGYHQLRQAVRVNKRLTVMAS